MLTLNRIGIMQYVKLRKLFISSRNNRLNCNFYSVFKGNLFHEILKRHVYSIYNTNSIIGIIIIDYKIKEIYFFPNLKNISIFKLLHILNKYFDTRGFKLSLNYTKINIGEIKKYFPIDVTENMMFMHKKIDINKIVNPRSDILKVRNLIVNAEEDLRVELQNKIFNNVRNRNALTTEEVFVEERNSKFLKNFCFILEVNHTPAGYGQIMELDNQFFLVNFGIIPEFRNKGYGNYFLNIISERCFNNGIKNLYLSVDKNNSNAINLYKKDGFSEIYNILTINFK